MATSDAALRVLCGGVASAPSCRADGEAVAVVVTSADLTHDRWRHQVVVVGVDGTPLGTSDGDADRHPRFAPVGDDLLFVRPDPAGTDTIVRWPDGGPAAALGDPVRQFEWSPDALRLAVVVRHVRAEGQGPIACTGPVYKRDGESWPSSTASILVVDLASGVVVPVLGPVSTIGDVAWTHDGAGLIVALPHDPRSWRWDLHHIELSGHTIDRLTDHGAWNRAACPLSTASGVVYVGGESGPRHAELVRLDEAGTAQPLAPALDRNITIGAPAYPGARPGVADGHVWFTANDRSVSRLFAVPERGGTAVAFTDDDTVVHGAATAGRRVVITTSTATRTSAVEVLGGPTLWAGDEHVAPWSIEQLDVTAPDGATVPCWLLRSRSAGPGPAPTLVDLHGGPHNVANPVLSVGNLHRWLLAEQGWQVLLPNVRGSDGFGEAWYRGLEAGGGWAGDDVDDVLSVVAAAVAAGIADPARIAVHGYSYGGLLVAALTSTTDVFRAAAMGGAPVDLRAFVTSSDLPQALWEREVGGLPWANGDYDERSPIRRVGHVRTPTLIVHGTNDHRVPVSQGEQWFQCLQANGVPSELLLYPGASHGFVTSGSPATVADVGRRIADWLTRWTTAEGRAAGGQPAAPSNTAPSNTTSSWTSTRGTVTST